MKSKRIKERFYKVVVEEEEEGCFKMNSYI